MNTTETKTTITIPDAILRDWFAGQALAGISHDRTD